MRTINLILGACFFLLAFFVLCFAVHWNLNRVYVPEGHSLLLNYKGPMLLGSAPDAKPGHFADPEQGEKGVLQEMPGPGRHFYCPIWWKTEIVPDLVVEPGEVAIITSKLGDPLPQGEFLVDGELGATKNKGMLRKVFGPGRYRLNPYGYEFRLVQTLAEPSSGGSVKYAGWVEVPAGYVGVVTNQDDNPLTGAKKGVQSNVLPPGL